MPGWEDLPDVAVPVGTGVSWEDLPDVEPSGGLPVDNYVTARTTESTFSTAPTPAFDMGDPALQQRQTQNNTLNYIFERSQVDPTDVAALAIAKRLNVDTKYVKANLPEWKNAAAKVDFDPERIPEPMRKMMLNNPELAQVVMVQPELNFLAKALNAASDFLELDKPTATYFGRPGSEQLVDPSRPWATQQQLASEFQARLDDVLPARARRDTPAQVAQVDDNKAKLLREDSGLGNAVQIAIRRREEAKAGLAVSKLSAEALLLDLNGKDSTDIDSRIHDAQLAARPRNYGEGPWGQFVTDAIAGEASSTEVLGNVVERGGVVGTLGLVSGGLAGLAVTRTPAGALAGALEVGAVAAKVGAGVGALETSFYLEAGSSRLELLELTTDAGNKLTKKEVAAASILAGAFKAGIEVAEFSALAKLSGLSAFVRPGGAKALTKELGELMVKNPKFRQQMLRAVGTAAKSIGVEFGEEIAQDVTDATTEYVAASAKDAKLQEGPVYTIERGLETGSKAIAGALGFGGATAAVRLGLSRVVIEKNARDEAKLDVLNQLANDKTVQAAPEAFAEMVADVADSKGEKVGVHVDASAIVRYYQQKGADGKTANAEVAELLGPEGPQQLMDAAATGGKLEVPMAAYLEKWGASEVGKATLKDTATDASHLSANELKAQRADIEAEAQAVAEAELAKVVDEQKTSAMADELHAEVVAAGRSKREAKGIAGLFKHLWETQAADFGIAAEELFKDLRVRFGKGDESVTPEGALKQTEDDGEGRARDLFFDDVSGLRNARGWEASQRTPGKQVAVITSTDVKPINDEPTGSHPTTNAFLRGIGGVIGKTDAEAARDGTNFFVHVDDQAQLNTLLDEIRATLPEGLSVDGHIGETRQTAAEALEATIDSERAAGTRPARGQTAFDLTQLSDDLFTGAAATVQTSEGLRAQAAALSQTAYESTAFRDPANPYVLTKLGFDRAPTKRFTASLDGKGLKRINTDISKEFGNDWLAEILDSATRVGGEGVYFAHLSGDEFAIKADSREELQAFIGDLEAELQERPLAVIIDGDERYLSPQLRHGIAEGGYGLADRELNRRKRLEPAEAVDPNDNRRVKRLPGEKPQGGLSVPGSEVSRRMGAQERRARAELRRAREASGRDRQDAGQPEDVDPKKLNQPDGGGGLVKGYLELPETNAANKTLKVFLNKSADASTLLHESGHAFLEMLGALSARPDAPQRTKDNYAEALKWLGVEPGQAIPVEAHEKFARGFEAWFYEGKAPSSSLAKVFQRWKLWLMSIYRSVASLDVELNDDIRNVFSRLLAADEEIERQAKKHGPPLATPGKRTFDGQAEAARVEMHEATRSAELLVLRERHRETEAWYKEALAKETAAAEAAYEQLPARQAQRILNGEADELVLAGEPMVLDKAFVAAVLGEQRAPGIRTAVDGVNPDEVAQMSGFVTGAEMLRSVVDLPGKASWVAKNADAAMAEKHPSALDERTELRKLIADGLASYSVKRILEDDASLRSSASMLKRAADVMVERMKLGELKPGRALQRERTAAQAKMKAVTKGEWVKAHEAGKQQLLNAYLHKAMLEAKEEHEALEKLADSLSDAKAQARLGKASPFYRDGVAYLLGAVGLGPRTEFGAALLHDVVAQINADSAIAGDPDWLEPMLNVSAVDPRELTVTEMRQLTDALKRIRAATSEKNEKLRNEKRVDHEELTAELVMRGETGKGALAIKAAQKAKSARKLMDTLGAGYDSYTGYLAAPADMFGDLSGGDTTSPWFEAFVVPLRGAKHTEARLLKEKAGPIIKAFEAIPKEVRRRMGEAIDGRKLFPNHVRDFLPSTRLELIMMAANAGNPGNMQRMTDGRNITRDEVVAAIDMLTKEEIEFANSIVEAVGSLKEESFALEERTTGRRPREVEASPIQLQNGLLKGGYFPIVNQEGATRQGDRSDAGSVADFFDAGFNRIGTATGHLKSRAKKNNRVISLEPDGIYRHLAQSVHDIAFREPIQSVAGLLVDPRIEKVIIERLGPAAYKQIKKWLQDVGTNRGAPVTGGIIEQGFRALKGNMAPALLGGVLTQPLGDLTNLPASVFLTDLKAKHLASAFAEIGRNPIKSYQLARELSPELRTMENTIKNDFVGMEKSFAAGKASRARRWLIQNSFFMVEAVQKLTATPVWLGSYRQSLLEGKSEQEAITFADNVLTQAFPQHSVVEQSAILRDKNVIGSMTVFHGFFNVVWRADYRARREMRTQEYKESGFFESRKTEAKYAATALGMLMITGVLAELLMGRGADDGDKDEEDPDNKLLQYRNYTVRKLLTSWAGTSPIGQPIASVAENVWKKRQVNERAAPVWGLVYELGRTVMEAFKDDVDEVKLAQGILRAAGMLGGLPTRQLGTTGGYLYQLNEGARDASNPFYFMSGIIHGERDNQPDTVPRLLGDGMDALTAPSQ